jgi:hypothetical protein
MMTRPASRRHPDSHRDVFISSTSKDLENHRREVIDAI